MGLFDKLFGSKKDTAKYHLQHGIDELYGGSGHYENAVEELSKAIEINGNLVDAYFNRGLAYHLLGKYELSINDFNSVLQLHPHNAYADYWKARAISLRQHDMLERQFLIQHENKRVISDNEATKIIGKVVSFLEQGKEYRSQLILRDLQCEELEEYQHEVIKWGFDFVSPDLFNITQFTRLENFPTGASDHWISIGKNTFITLLTAAVKTERGDPRTQIEKFLKIDKYYDAINELNKSSINVKQINSNALYFIEADLPRSFMLGNWPISEFRRHLSHSIYHVFGMTNPGESEIEFMSVPTVSESVKPHSIGVNPDLDISQEDMSVKMRLWVDAADYSIVKAQIEVAGYLENGNRTSLLIEQVFSDFNSNMTILSPPL